MKVLKILGIIILIIAIIIAAVIGYVKIALPGIPVDENIKVEITPERVERGEYLANHMMACMDCHSTRDWSKFSGPLVPGTLGKGGELFDETMGLPGKFISPNITPYNLKDWSDGEIFRAITAGVKKDGTPIFPIMPYHSYGKANKEDIYSVIAYLRQLKSIDFENGNSEPNFPMGIIMHLMPAEPTFSKIPPKSQKVEYGKYVTTISGCADCHTPLEKGQPVMEKAFAGGREFEMPFGTLTSPNITPDKNTGIGNWSKEMFIARFKNYDLSHYNPPKVDMKKDFQTIMPWTMYAEMDTTDLEAIYEYLMSKSPIDNQITRIKMNN